MSVWSTYQGAISLPPGTPELEIRRRDGEHVVIADGEQVHSTQFYTDAHRWCQNTYRLTTTMALPLVGAYEAAYCPAPQPENKYRKSTENKDG